MRVFQVSIPFHSLLICTSHHRGLITRCYPIPSLTEGLSKSFNRVCAKCFAQATHNRDTLCRNIGSKKGAMEAPGMDV